MDNKENQNIENKENIIKKDNKKNIKHEMIEWIICIAIAYVIYLFVNYYLIAISGVKQTSMLPTAVEGEKLFIVRTILFQEEIEFGDVITFVSPKYEVDDIEANYPLTDSKAIAEYTNMNGFESFIYNFIGLGKKSYIKRVIGLEGDHIFISEDGKVYRNDELLEEEYIKDGTTNRTGIYYDVIVPEGTLFVMGDNRLASLDSRYFGCVPEDKVDGYVKTRIWPFTKWGEL